MAMHRLHTLHRQTRPGIVGAPATKADREAHTNRRVAAIRS
ncbi:hypothetical protein [Streptomyces sp. NPDC001933]